MEKCKNIEENEENKENNITTESNISPFRIMCLRKSSTGYINSYHNKCGDHQDNNGQDENNRFECTDEPGTKGCRGHGSYDENMMRFHDSYPLLIRAFNFVNNHSPGFNYMIISGMLFLLSTVACSTVKRVFQVLSFGMWSYLLFSVEILIFTFFFAPVFLIPIEWILEAMIKKSWKLLFDGICILAMLTAGSILAFVMAWR